ncbi:MAG TPA: hypothetical protein VHC95_00985 [Opitutales bacterium]|nr:hypothetical protein [Opitutales bacterium]
MKPRRWLPLALSTLTMLAALGWLASCSKSTEQAAPSAPPVPAAGVSPIAAAIGSHLEYGGELYAVADMQGDIERMGNVLADFVAHSYEQSAGAFGTSAKSPDFRVLVKRLGLYNIDGFGLSSWKGSDGLHRNRGFLYTPNGRPGLLKIFGGGPGPFVTPDLAPADADLVVEGTLDLKSLEELIVSYVQDVSGPAAAQSVTEELKTAIPGTTLTGQSLVDRLNTRFILILRADPKQMLPVSATMKIPLTDFVIALDGFSDLFDQLAPLLKDNPMLTLADKNGLKTLTLEFPIPDPYSAYKLMLISDPKSKRLYLVSRESFANETVLGQGARLAASPDFKAATDGLPTQGNWLGYISQKGAAVYVEYFEKQFMTSIPPALRDSLVDLEGLNKLPHGLAMTQVNLPDGILTQSLSNRSAKDVLLLVPVATVAMVGFGATSTAPLMKSLLTSPSPSPATGTGSAADIAIRNNLRIIATAAQQYMLDKNAPQVRYTDLTSGPNPYVGNITPVSGENYDNIVLRQNTTRISVVTADGRIISFDL